MVESKKVISYITEGKIEARKYQEQIAEKCINKNSLVVIPTGLGKTIIAVLVAAKTLEEFPPESKIIMMAPTRPLINQHFNFFVDFLTIPEEKFVVLTGKTPPEKRAEYFENNQVIFFTPQTLRNDLVHQRYSLKDTCLVIFDEAHHSSGDYPYPMIADKYMDQNPDGNILALTASPGSSKQKIADLCDSLHIRTENIHIRTRDDSDVIDYIKPMDIYKIGVKLNNLMEDVYEALHHLLEERLQYLSHLGFLEKKGDPLFKKIIRKDLLRLNQELQTKLSSDGEKTGVYSALSVNAQALTIYHLLELLEQQGLDMLLTHLEKMNNDAKKPKATKSVRVLVADPTIRKMFITLKEKEEFSPEFLSHPKFPVLKKILLNELKTNPNSRILVFIKLRVSVANTVKKLKDVTGVKPVRFVGQASKSAKDKGLTQKKQIEILEDFKKGKYNVLVSTNVGEEGLDIAECDMVVFYDVVTSEIRFIQRKGRTARHREGKVIILYCKGTNDETYLQIALQKLKKMNVNLKNPRELKQYYEAGGGSRKECENSIAFPERENRPTQSTLGSFLDVKKEIELTPKKEIPADIQLNKTLPMKYGVRKRLHGSKIPFDIVNSEYSIKILSKIVIQIYNPKEIGQSVQKANLLKNKKLFTLFVAIFDFIDFYETYDGEKRLLKRKVQELGKDLNVGVVAIDDPEEFFFVLKNIYESRNGDLR